MNEIIVPCAGFSQEELHQALKSALHFPQWYGNNLDALYDCLTEIFEDTHLTFLDFPPLPDFRETLEDAAKENPCLSVTFL